MKNYTLLLTCLLSLQLAAQVTSPQFITPIRGAYLQDFYLVNYVDWSVDDIEDHQCHHKTYNGHQGTDFVIRNFRQMDAGVDVCAAAPGVVTYLVDGLFDRNKTAVSGGLGNYVAIRHFNDFYTYYGHLKKNSIAVQVGDTVAAKQIIGQVGSSGYASDPHLHFEVWYDSLYNWDPFVGPCGNTNSLWLDTLAYVHEFGVIDYDFSRQLLTLDTLKERLPSENVFKPSDAIVSFWMQGYGVFPGDVSTLKWFDPVGSLWFQFDYTHTAEWWYYYWWTYINVPPPEKAGQWTVQYLVNNDLKILDTFTVTGASSLQEPQAAVSARIFQNVGGELVLQWPDHQPFDDEISIVDMMGRQVYSASVTSTTQSLTLPGLPMLPSAVYVLYSKNGRLKPCRFLYVGI